MPRVKPHAKLHVSLKGHRKTATMFRDNDLLATYGRILTLGIERYADRTGDVLTVHDSEVEAITGKGRRDVARRLLQRLADLTPICVQPDGDLWLITIPNFAKKQGFGARNGAGMEDPSTSASSATATATSSTQDAASAAPPVSDPVTPKPKRKAPRAPVKIPMPDPYPDHERDLLADWLDDQDGWSAAHADYVLGSVRDAAGSNGREYADWNAACRNYVTRGWLTPPTPGGNNGSSTGPRVTERDHAMARHLERRGVGVTKQRRIGAPEF